MTTQERLSKMVALVSLTGDILEKVIATADDPAVMAHYPLDRSLCQIYRGFRKWERKLRKEAYPQ